MVLVAVAALTWVLTLPGTVAVGVWWRWRWRHWSQVGAVMRVAG
jgi:hypothetical protein